MQIVGLAVVLTLQLALCLAEGDSVLTFRSMREEASIAKTPEDGPKLVCYYTPTGYFPVSKVPSNACTHIVYAFGSISRTPPTITAPTAGVKAIWATLTSLRGPKVLLSLQQGFPDVVGADLQRMQQFADNAVAFLRKYKFDGVDMDWEYPSSAQKTAFAHFFTIMRAAIEKDAKTRGEPALLLSLALPNNKYVASRSYDLVTIASAVDFATAMTYDFHVYNSGDTRTGYNSPLVTPPDEPYYLSASAMISYYLDDGDFPSSKLLLGVPTYGRSWELAQSSSHGLHSPALGKGPPGPHRHLRGVYTYPDACVAIGQGAKSVRDPQAGAVYLYHKTTWVAYDDVTTVTNKTRWAKGARLGGVGVWAMHLDDVEKTCGGDPLPLITAIKETLMLA